MAGEMSAGLIAQARSVGTLLRDGQLGLLVGAGLSRSVNLPDWTELLRRLVFLEWLYRTDHGQTTRSYRQFWTATCHAFPDALQLAQALRSWAGEATFSDRLRKALYGPAAGFAGWDPANWLALSHENAAFDPNDLAHHLVAVATGCEPRPTATIHTLNFDDLLDRAAKVLYPSLAHTATRPQNRRGITIEHLHGLLPYAHDGKPEGLILTAEDFHRARGEQRWAYRRLYALFEEQSVLMVGIGLADPNVLQVLDLARGKQHYLIRAQPGGSSAAADLRQDTWDLQRTFWEDEAKIEFIVLEDWSDLSAFLSAVRHFQHESTPWTLGAEHLLDLTQRRSFAAYWEPRIRNKAARLLNNLTELARSELSMSSASTLHAGIFVPNGDGDSLDLPFRSDVEEKVSAGEYAVGRRVLRANIESPQGVAGLSYARGEMIIATPDADHFDNNFEPTMIRDWHPDPPRYAVVASAPVFDWEHGYGLPVGIAYITSTEANDLSADRLAAEDLRFLREVILGKGAARVLRLLRKEVGS